VGEPEESDDGSARRQQGTYALHISRYAYTLHTLAQRVTEEPRIEHRDTKQL
jgi:hypothetical protein